MRRIEEAFDLPSDWGHFTNVGMTLDTATPLFGLGSAKYNAANVEYATAPILAHWASYYVWTGKHFRQDNVASTTPNWIFGWRSEATPGNVVEGGAVGVVNSRLCLRIGTAIVATGRRLLANNTIFNLQVELWHNNTFGWVKVKINNRAIPDLIFNGATAISGEAFLSQVWVGSLYGGGSGNCWVDDFLLNDQQPFLSQDQGWPGMTILQQVESDVEGAYGQFLDVAGDQVVTTPLSAPIPDSATGVIATPFDCDNTLDAVVPCVIAIYGPITDITVANVTTSETISVTGVVPDGSRLIIDTAGQNVYLMTSTLDSPVFETEDWNAFVGVGADWFSLLAGINSINVTGTGGTGNDVVVGWASYQIGPKDSFTFDAKPAAPTAPMGTASLSAVDHVYRMKIEGTLPNAGDKIIPGMRRLSVDYNATLIQAHLFPTSLLASHIDRMRMDRATDALWNPANVDSTQAVWQYSNFDLALAQQQADFGVNPPVTPPVPPPPVSIPTPPTTPTFPAVSPPPPTYPPSPAPTTPTPVPIVVGPNPPKFIALSGNNSNPGTESQPWRDFTKTSVLVPGDTVYVRGGDYGNDGIYGAGMGRFPGRVLRGGNSWSEAIKFSGFESEFPTIFGVGASSPDFKYIIAHRFLISATNHEAVYLHKGHHLRVQYSDITTNFTLGQGVFFPHAGDDYNEILFCRIFECGEATPHDPPPQIHGGYIAGRYNLFFGCDVFDNWGYGLQVYNGYSGERADGNRIIGCRGWGNGVGGSAAAFALSSGADGEISNCVAWDNPRAIDVAWKNPNRSKVWYNTCFDNGAGITINSDSTNADVRNNLLYLSGAITDLGVGTIKTSNLVGTNPLFVNSGAQNFHLQSGSPARNVGVPIAAVPKDFDGRVRPQGTLPCVGAFEFV